jgi:hypothetical protein
MCTLTIVPVENDHPRARGLRLVCSRDESRLRPPALPPDRRRCGQRSALMPIDPQSGGTWIGVSDAPLAAVLMNVYLVQADGGRVIAPANPMALSRGTIIPSVLAADNLAGALTLASQLDIARFEPFRLVIAAGSEVAEVCWAAGQFSVTGPEPISTPMFFTSSGLGDDIVATPRRKLFDEFFTPDADWPAAQDAFHRHVWPERAFASVWMTRREARTQSITWVDVGARSVRMQYGARPADDSELQLDQSQELPLATAKAGADG